MPGVWEAADMNEATWRHGSNPRAMMRWLERHGLPERTRRALDNAFINILGMNAPAIRGAKWLSPETARMAADIIRDVIGNPFRR